MIMEYTTACPDWEERLITGKSIIPVQPLYPEQAKLALNIFNSLILRELGANVTFGKVNRQWTEDFVSALFGSYNPETGTRDIIEFMLLISKKNGKDLALDTKIPTPSGWSTMGELSVGDKVYASNGSVCNVTGVSEIFTSNKCYNIVFSNGQEIVAGEGHLWKTVDRITNNETVKTTKDIYDTLVSDGRYNHSINIRAFKKESGGNHCIYIHNIEKVETVPTRCIEVDSYDHLFLCGEKYIPTHNSSLAAGIMLTALIINWRDSASYAIIAPTKSVADNSFIPIRDMIASDERLSKMFTIYGSRRTIVHNISKAELVVSAAESKSVAGSKYSGILIDELHLFGKKDGAGAMIMEAIGGLASRPEGFVIYLTTQSDEPPSGVFKQRLHYARDVRDGVIEDKTFLPVLYEFPRRMLDNEEYLEPDNFHITNPNLDASVSSQFISRGLAQAHAASVNEYRQFLSKHLNVEMGMNLRNDVWAGAEFWREAERDYITLDYILSQSDCVVVGLDGGGLDDLLGFNVLGRDRENGKWMSWSKAWAHEIVLRRQKVIAAQLNDFVIDNDLVLVQNIGEDAVQVAELIRKIQDTGKLHMIGIDPFKMGTLIESIVAAGVDDKLITGINQGGRLGGAIKTAERKLADGSLIVAPQALARWSVGNAKVELKGNAILISKAASGQAKIDTVMAMLSSLTIMATNPEMGTDFEIIRV